MRFWRTGGRTTTSGSVMGTSTRQGVVERMTGIGTYEWRTSPQRVTWSEQMFRIFGYEPGEVEPSLMLVVDRAHPEDRDTLRRLIEWQEDEPHERTHVFRIVRPDGEVRILLAIVGAVVTQADGEPMLIGTIQDVTAPQLTARALAAHHSVSRTFGSWDSLDTPLVDLLAGLGTSLDWAVGGLWVPDDGSGVLECVAFWSEPELDATELERAARSFRFPGTAAIGRAWTTKAAVGVEDVGSDPEFLRRDPACAIGLRSWASFPALHGDEVLAVVELFSRYRRPLDSGLEETLDAIGRMLGEFLAWRRGELQSRVTLTARERQVLQLAARGLHGAESARELEVSPATIKSHFRNIFEKLGVSDRAAAVAQGMRLGLIS